MKHDEKLLYCRKCDDFNVEFDGKMTFQMQAKRVRKMKIHEKSCKCKRNSKPMSKEEK